MSAPNAAENSSRAAPIKNFAGPNVGQMQNGLKRSAGINGQDRGGFVLGAASCSRRGQIRIIAGLNVATVSIIGQKGGGLG